MIFLGLTGSIGSGKSTVAKILKKLGANIVDADALAKDSTTAGALPWMVLSSLFPRFFDAAGKLNRVEFAKHIFSNEDDLKLVNKIIHKDVHQKMIEQVTQITTDNPRAIVIYDVPLLFEIKLESIFQKIILVTASDHLVNSRLVSQKQLNIELVEQIRSKQQPAKSKINKAHFVIENNGSLDELNDQVKRMWDEIKDLPNLSFDIIFLPLMNQFAIEQYFTNENSK